MTISEWLALASVLVGTATLWSIVRNEQAVRLGVEFRLVRSLTMPVVNSGPPRRRGTCHIYPRGPGVRFDVYATVWPPSLVTPLDAELRPLMEGAGPIVKRWDAQSEPITVHYMHRDAPDEDDGATPMWVGIVWEQPGLFGGFVPGGWRVRIDQDGTDPGQKWSRMRKQWVTYGRKRSDPKRHPAYGSSLHPSLTPDPGQASKDSPIGDIQGT